MPSSFPIPQMAEGSDTRLITRVAGGALGGNRVVIAGDDGKVYYADQSVLSHRDRVVGITTGAIVQDASGDIQIFGIMTEPGWNWTMELPIFLSLVGLLTQTPPSSGFALVLGFPLSATSMMISKQTAIILA